MKSNTTTRIIVSLSTAFLLGFPTLAGAAEPSEELARADTRSAGVEADSTNIWCLIDGGTLGLDHPLEACAR